MSQRSGPFVFLTREDVFRLTARRRFSAQRRVLDAMGVRYIQAATGEPMVRESELDYGRGKARNGGPKWNRIAA